MYLLLLFLFLLFPSCHLPLPLHRLPFCLFQSLTLICCSLFLVIHSPAPLVLFPLYYWLPSPMQFLFFPSHNHSLSPSPLMPLFLLPSKNLLLTLCPFQTIALFLFYPLHPSSWSMLPTLAVLTFSPPLTSCNLARFPFIQLKVPSSKSHL